MIRMEIKTRVLPADEAGVAEAAQLLRQGQLVALPTETVYGIAADARNGAAVRDIFVAKGRPQDNPLIVHVTGPEMLPGLVSEVPERAQLLMAAFCPGPLTIIMPRGPEVADECCAGLDTVGIRMPSHPVARAVIQQSGCAFAAPSANLSGKPSPTNAQDVFTDMDGRLPLILDGGECQVGLESTVIDLTSPIPTVLRPGGVTPEMLLTVLKEVKVADSVLRPLREGEKALSPGMRYRHYAPSGKLTMATNAYFEPWEYYDGENIVGIDPEVAQAIADKLGLELEIMDMDFDSIITAVSAGKADMGMAGMTVTEERQKNVDFSQTYASAVQAIIVPDGSDIKTADDMEGKKIGVMQGFTGDLSCTEQFGEDAVVRFNKSAEAVMALTQGKIDCIVIDNEPAKKIIEANSGLTILDSKYSQEDYAIAFAKGNDGLRDAVDAALGELISDGTVEQIMNKYIVAD